MEEERQRFRSAHEASDTRPPRDTPQEQEIPSDISSRISEAIDRVERSEEKSESQDPKEDNRTIEQRLRDVEREIVRKEVHSRISDALDKIERTSIEKTIESKAPQSRVNEALDEFEKKSIEDTDGPSISDSEKRLSKVQKELDALKESGVDVSNVNEALKDLYKELGVDEQSRSDATFGSDVKEREASEPRVNERGTWEVKMYEPEVDGKKVESFDEVRDHLENVHPGLKEHRDFDTLMEHGEKHWKVVEHFQGRTEVTNKEITEFAKSIDAPEPTVRPWVTKESAPGIYSIMESAMSREEAEKRIGSIREGLGDLGDIDALRDKMNEPYFEKHMKQTSSWEKDWESSERFYRFLDEMEKGGTIGDVSRRVGIAQSSGQRYLDGRLPTLVKAGLESSRLRVKEYNDIIPMESKEELHGAIERHNYLKDRKDFPELKHRAEFYIDIKELQRTNQLPDIKQRDWAYQMGISQTALNDYLQDKKRPELFKLLNASEKARQLHESKLAPEAFEHRLDPSIVYENFRHLKGIENPTPVQLADVIEKLHAASFLESSVQFAEMTPYNYHSGPKWIS
ncbi:MAG: hypothetical protein P1Q69_19360, partial [Candidatus Thorarchaeota archaeon]|nr:hypothetical protein [Candidatus Thorarchaeota archaeon]